LKKAIITGISGQDGVYLARLLLDKGYEVVGIVRSCTTSSLSNLQYLHIESKVKIVRSDLGNLVAVINLIKEYQPNEVYNLSAQSSVSASFKDPIGAITYNTISVLNLLEAIKLVDNRVKFYQASSSDMFGNIDDLPITINTQMKPISPYAVSKASSHWSVVCYRESYSLFAVSGILFNHESKLRTNNFFIKKVISDSVDISLGIKDVLYVGNINIKRDFGYAPKYVEAMWLMLQQDTPKDYLICSGRSIKLRDIVEYVFDELNIPKEKIVVDDMLYRPTEIYDIYGDNSLAKNELQWSYDMNFFDVLKKLIEHEVVSRKN
jgi:GDPmannose 4,6-dehydratase